MRVLICDDSALFRRGLALLLTDVGVEVAGQTAGVEQLHTAVTAEPPTTVAATATRIPLDLVRVEADGHTTWSAAHVVCRRSWWRGEVVLAMTAQYLGDHDVTPRGHPNDGKVDVLRVDPAMPARARWQATRRARTATHLPHPQLAVRQLDGVELAFARPLHVWVDGSRWRTAEALCLTVEPDAYAAYV